MSSLHQYFKLVVFLGLTFILESGCNSSNNLPKGGYSYPEKTRDKDSNTYFYAIKDSGTKRDIFERQLEYLFYKPINEANISLKPLKKETIRLRYDGGVSNQIVVILNEDEIIVKSSDSYYFNDTMKLLPTERVHWKLLEKFYPLEDCSTGGNVSYKKYCDSLLTLYPELKDEKYYLHLAEKSLSCNDSSFKYTTKKINFSTKQFNELIKEINAMGFWQMPYQTKCENLTIGANYFLLELNTLEKYNVVGFYDCSNTKHNFSKICQHIINLANLEEKIKLQ